MVCQVCSNPRNSVAKHFRGGTSRRNWESRRTPTLAVANHAENNILVQNIYSLQVGSGIFTNKKHHETNILTQITAPMILAQPSFPSQTNEKVTKTTFECWNNFYVLPGMAHVLLESALERFPLIFHFRKVDLIQHHDLRRAADGKSKQGSRFITFNTTTTSQNRWHGQQSTPFFLESRGVNKPHDLEGNPFMPATTDHVCDTTAYGGACIQQDSLNQFPKSSNSLRQEETRYQT